MATLHDRPLRDLKDIVQNTWCMEPQATPIYTQKAQRNLYTSINSLSTNSVQLQLVQDWSPTHRISIIQINRQFNNRILNNTWRRCTGWKVEYKTFFRLSVLMEVWWLVLVWILKLHFLGLLRVSAVLQNLFFFLTSFCTSPLRTRKFRKGKGKESKRDCTEQDRYMFNTKQYNRSWYISIMFITQRYALRRFFTKNVHCVHVSILCVRV